MVTVGGGARGRLKGAAADSQAGGRQQMTGPGLRATALIGRDTLIKTEKCPQTAAAQDEEVEREEGRRMWCCRERNRALKNVLHMEGGGRDRRGGGANCVQLSG